ncbi:MAG: hypothetical protein AUG75_19855 [Cyanobacteria bacterium 13_1_20CM_4_61_6]|nr:MAG: hypothetical protein AUG75_19855 [Cyanobacteria bacterium 13_1_20CM_4_61_6]
MSERDIQLHLPNLKRPDYSIESPKNPSYNCIAWVFLDTTRRWDPAFIPGYYWPDGISRSIAVDSVIGMFETIGHFEKCQHGDLEAGFEKIAIYEDADRDFSHVARQKSDGNWTSKLGRLDDIDHSNPLVLEQDYGLIVQFLKRPRKNGEAQSS